MVTNPNATAKYIRYTPAQSGAAYAVWLAVHPIRTVAASLDLLVSPLPPAACRLHDTCN